MEGKTQETSYLRVLQETYACRTRGSKSDSLTMLRCKRGLIDGPGIFPGLEEAADKSAMVHSFQLISKGGEMRSLINLASYANFRSFRDGQFRPPKARGAERKT